MAPQDDDTGTREGRAGLVGWLRNNWDEPSGVGKAKLAAVAVLALLVIALFSEDDRVPRPDQPASHPATVAPAADTVTGAAVDLAEGVPPDRMASAPADSPPASPGGLADEGLPPHSYVTEPVLPGAVDVPLITTTNTPLVPELLDSPARPAPPDDKASDLQAENARLQAALEASQARVEALEQALEKARGEAARDDRSDLKAEVDALRQRLNELLDQLRDRLDARSVPEATPTSVAR